MLPILKGNLKAKPKKKKKIRKKNKFGHIKRNYLQKKLEKFIIDNVDQQLISILSPKDFSNIFVENIKNLNENKSLISQIEYYLQILVKNTIKKSIRINKIKKKGKKKD